MCSTSSLLEFNGRRGTPAVLLGGVPNKGATIDGFVSSVCCKRPLVSHLSLNPDQAQLHSSTVLSSTQLNSRCRR